MALKHPLVANTIFVREKVIDARWILYLQAVDFLKIQNVAMGLG